MIALYNLGMNLKICYGKNQNTITDKSNSWNVTKKRDKIRRLDNLIIKDMENDIELV